MMSSEILFFIAKPHLSVLLETSSVNNSKMKQKKQVLSERSLPNAN